MPIEALRPDSVTVGRELGALRPDVVFAGRILESLRPDIFDSASITSRRPDVVTCGRVISSSRGDVVQVGQIPAFSPVVIPLDSGERKVYYPADARMELWGPDDLLIPTTSLSLSTAFGSGWRWSAELPEFYSPRFSAYSKFRIQVIDGLGASFWSPKLVSQPRSAVDNNSIGGGSASLGGSDLTSWRIGRNNQSFPSFRRTLSTTILQTLAARVGVEFSGLENFSVGDEEAKNVKLADAISRLSAITAQQWHIDKTGKMQFVTWGNTGGELKFDWSTATLSEDPSLKFTGINIGKRSAQVGNTENNGLNEFRFKDAGFKVVQLKAPIWNAQLAQRSTVGFVDWISLWQGDPTKGGKHIRFFAGYEPPANGLNTATTGTWPATHATMVAFPSGGLSGFNAGETTVECGLDIVGSPYASPPAPEPLDPEFFYPFGDLSGEEAWPAEDWIDNLFPNRAWAVEKAPKLLAIKNEGWSRLELEGPMHASVWLNQEFDYIGSKYCAKSVAWQSAAGGAPTTSIGLVIVDG